MRTSTIRRVLTRAMILTLLVPFMAACNKEKPTMVVITTRYPDGNVAPDTYVKLFANPPVPLGDQTRLIKEGYSNSAGEATFDYSEFYEKGQSGFAVLDIYCVKDSLIGEGIIKVEEEKTNEEDVYLMVP